MNADSASIIIPCYNAVPWIGEAVESALGQQGVDVEVIVVDDGSTDDSLRVAREFEPRGVRVLVQPGRGMAAARNAGLEKAGGDWIQFLDTGDLLAPDKIARQAAVLRENPGWIASGEWARFTTGISGVCFTPEPVWCDFPRPLDFQVLHYERGWMMHKAAWLCPRAILNIAGPWDESLSLDDDGEYFSRVMLVSQGIRFVAGARSYCRSSAKGAVCRRLDLAALRSLERATALNCERMLRLDSSPRVRQAAANAWQWLAFESYPAAPEISVESMRRCAGLGGSPFPMPAGPTFQMARRIIGWHLAKRLRDWQMRHTWH